MTSIVLPFLLSMFLGRTIDLTTYTVGGDIYDHQDYIETPLNITSTSYYVFQDNTYPYHTMGIPVDIVLRIKGNYLSSTSGIMGLDGVLKDTIWKYDSVMVAIFTVIQTTRRDLKPDASLVSNWTDRLEDTQTHCVNSIIYGGWNAIFLRLKCDLPGDIEAVRKTLASVLGVTGQVGPEIVELWKEAIEKIEKDESIRGKVRVGVQTYSTTPLTYVDLTVENILEIISEFPKKVGELGQPLYMELKPLHELDPKFPAVQENHELDKMLEFVDEMFDDIHNTKSALLRWVLESLEVYTEQEEEEIDALLHHLNRCSKLVRKVASEATVYKLMDQNILRDAALCYTHGLRTGAKSYYELYLKLKEDINSNCKDSFRRKVKGLLNVKADEHIEIGTLAGGVEDCKTLCLSEERCRAIGFVDSITITLSHRKGDVKTVKKANQCHIYFRSTNTASIYTPNGAENPAVYDRKCD